MQYSRYSFGGFCATLSIRGFSACPRAGVAKRKGDVMSPDGHMLLRDHMPLHDQMSFHGQMPRPSRSDLKDNLRSLGTAVVLALIPGVLCLLIFAEGLFAR